MGGVLDDRILVIQSGGAFAFGRMRLVIWVHFVGV